MFSNYITLIVSFIEHLRLQLLYNIFTLKVEVIRDAYIVNYWYFFMCIHVYTCVNKAAWLEVNTSQLSFGIVRDALKYSSFSIASLVQ